MEMIVSFLAGAVLMFLGIGLFTFLRVTEERMPETVRFYVRRGRMGNLILFLRLCGGKGRSRGYFLARDGKIEDFGGLRTEDFGGLEYGNEPVDVTRIIYDNTEKLEK